MSLNSPRGKKEFLHVLEWFTQLKGNKSNCSTGKIKKQVSGKLGILWVASQILLWPGRAELPTENKPWFIYMSRGINNLVSYWTAPWFGQTWLGFEAGRKLQLAGGGQGVSFLWQPLRWRKLNSKLQFSWCHKSLRYISAFKQPHWWTTKYRQAVSSIIILWLLPSPFSDNLLE